MIETKKLTKKFGKNIALNNLDFNDAEITEILAKAMAKKWTSEEFEFMFSGGENYEKWKYQDEMFSTTILGYALSTLYDR